MERDWWTPTKAQRGWLDPTLRAREQGTLQLLKIEHVLGDGGWILAFTEGRL